MRGGKERREGEVERWRGTERERVQKGQATLEPSPDCLFQSTEGVTANERCAFLTSQNVPGKVPNLRLKMSLAQKPHISRSPHAVVAVAAEEQGPASAAGHTPRPASHLVIHAPHKAQCSHLRKPPLPSVPVETRQPGD